jgi:hypothetical protein
MTNVTVVRAVEPVPTKAGDTGVQVVPAVSVELAAQKFVAAPAVVPTDQFADVVIVVITRAEAPCE